jgi:hypothetical protein
MEKETKKGRFAIKRRNVVLSTFLAASLSAGMTESLTSGKNPSEVTTYPQSDFNPVTIYQDSENKRAYSNIEIAPTPIPEKTKEEKDKEELGKILDIMKTHDEVFNNKKIEDVKMYYPIYKAASEKYDIDWFLLFIVHEAETGASRGDRGFAPDSYYIGAMQRDPNVWPDFYVEKSADGLEELAKLPQRHKNDWKEIAAAAHMLSDNFHNYKDQGESRGKAVLKALIRYSAEEYARDRFELYKEYNKVFNNEAEIMTPIKLS